MSETSVAAAGTSPDPSARITRIPVPVASPGCCVICGKNEHPDGFLQFGLDFEFHGTLYFCADCAGECARAFGFLSPDDFVSLREHIAQQDGELNTLRQAVLGLESTVDGLVADAHRRSSERADAIDRGRKSDARDDVPSDPVDEPDAGLPESIATEPITAPVAGERTSNQPAVEQGPNDVSGTPSADELLGL